MSNTDSETKGHDKDGAIQIGGDEPDEFEDDDIVGFLRSEGFDVEGDDDNGSAIIL